MKISVIITGSTGMVGEAVLHECLYHPDIERILVLNRRPCNIVHPKLTEVIADDFFDLDSVEQKFTGYNACFYCLGITSLRTKEKDYYHVTYELTMEIAKRLERLNQGMTFCYISGAGTTEPEKAKFMWARVKGQTEQDLLKLKFRQVYLFRPGLLRPTRGLLHAHKLYFLFDILYPVFRFIMPGFVSTLKELALAMISSVTKGYQKQILEVTDIVRLSNSHT
jgi:uncharacterized protein YbjT (DUF2867 family)